MDVHFADCTSPHAFTSSLRQMKQSQLSSDVFGGASFLSVAHRNEWLLSSLVDGCFVLKRFVFSTSAPLFNDTRILLLTDIFMESTGCF